MDSAKPFIEVFQVETKDIATSPIKIEEEELTSTLEKERVWEGPEAREVRPRACRSVRG